MMTEAFKTIILRDLQKLKTEIESYRYEDCIWYIEERIANSAGNLCMHLVGNLNTFIGVALANTDYRRDRDLEFSIKNVPRAELIRKLDDTLVVVEDGLSKLTDAQLSDPFPMLIWEKETEIGYTLLHLATHLNYHLGQVNYHRRLLDEA